MNILKPYARLVWPFCCQRWKVYWKDQSKSYNESSQIMMKIWSWNLILIFLQLQRKSLTDPKIVNLGHGIYKLYVATQWTGRKSQENLTASSYPWPTFHRNLQDIDKCDEFSDGLYLLLKSDTLFTFLPLYICNVLY